MSEVRCRCELCGALGWTHEARTDDTCSRCRLALHAGRCPICDACWWNNLDDLHAVAKHIAYRPPLAHYLLAMEEATDPATQPERLAQLAAIGEKWGAFLPNNRVTQSLWQSGYVLCDAVAGNPNAPSKTLAHLALRHAFAILANPVMPLLLIEWKWKDWDDVALRTLCERALWSGHELFPALIQVRFADEIGHMMPLWRHQHEQWARLEQQQAETLLSSDDPSNN